MGTFGGGRWCEVEGVSEDVVVVPHVQLVVPGVVVDGRDVLVGVGEGDLDGQLLAAAGVVGVDHHVPAHPALRLALVVLEDGADGVQHAARHEGVAGAPLVKARGPGALEAQRVGVDLGDTRRVRPAALLPRLPPAIALLFP